MKNYFEFKELEFTDVIYEKNLLELKNVISDATGCGLCITDNKGENVTGTEKGCSACRIFNDSQKNKCFLCQSELVKKALVEQKEQIKNCEELNLYFAVIPVFIRNTCLGFFNISSKLIQKDIYSKDDILKIKEQENISKEKFLVYVELIKSISKNIAERAFLNYLFIGELVSTMETLFSKHEQEKIFDTLTNHTIIGTSYVNMDGIILEANDRFSEMLGYKKEELIGNRINKYVGESDEVFRKSLGELTASDKGSHYLEKEFYRKDGSIAYIAITSTLIEPKGKPDYFFSIYHDITDKNKFEEEILAISKFTSENPNPVLRIRNDGIVLYMNNASEKIADIYSLKTNDYAREDIISMVSYAYNNGKETIQILEHERKYFRFTFIPFKEDGFVNIYVMDVTELKSAEKYALDNERRFKAISEASFETLLIHENAIIKEINYRVKEMFGYNPDEVIGQNALRLISPEFHDEIQKKIKNNQEEMYDSIGVRKDGTRIYIRIHARPYIYKGKNVRAVAIDNIDDMKRFEISTEQALKKFKDIINLSPLGIFTFELSEKGQLIFTEENKAAKEMTGIDRSADYGKSFEQIFPYMKDSDLGKIFKAVAELGRSYRIENYEYNTPVVNAIYEIAVFQTKPGEIAVQMHDITQAERYKEKLKNLNEELEKKVRQRTNQLELINSELENFSNMVSHDLKSPLNIISGYADMLEMELGDNINEQEMNYISKIHSGISRMSELIGDILRFSRINQENLTKSEFNISHLVRDVFYSLLNEDDMKRYELKLKDDLNIYGDKDLIIIVLENIIGNAIKYSSKEQHPVISFYKEVIKEKDYFVVEDNGVGFPKELAETIFKPLKRAHKESEFPGTGIGLATVKRVVKKHGGEVFARSDGENGAKFYFRFD